MSNKYVIKNCPAYCEKLLSYDFSTNTSEVTDRYVCIGSISNSNYHCQDCTDCVLKQIVELCMEDWEDMTTDRFQRELLDLLDIREVE